MAALVQTVVAYVASNTASPAALTTKGNTLILVQSIGSSATLTSVTDTKSNTWTIDKQTASARNVAIASTNLSAALTTGDTITCHVSAGTGAFAVWEFAGVVATSPLDGSASNTGASVATLSVTYSTALKSKDELVISGLGTAAGSAFVTPSGYTDGVTSGSALVHMAWKTITTAAAGLGTATWSWTTNANCGSALVSYVINPPLTWNNYEFVDAGGMSVTEKIQ